MRDFDLKQAPILRRIWFLGDVHGQLVHVAPALLNADIKPLWLVFLGDIELQTQSFRESIAHFQQACAGVKVAFIHGNHDADSHAQWDLLHDCGDAVALHGKVLDLDGVRVAGLGGNFLGRVWNPPAQINYHNKHQATHRGAYQWRDGQQPNSKFSGAIYPDDVTLLSQQRADILVTHEAPSCHPHGYWAIDDLARMLGVKRSFHGHQHDDLSDQYALVRNTLGFDAKAVNFRGIKDGLGGIIYPGGGEATDPAKSVQAARRRWR